MEHLAYMCVRLIDVVRHLKLVLDVIKWTLLIVPITLSVKFTYQWSWLKLYGLTDLQAVGNEVSAKFLQKPPARRRVSAVNGRTLPYGRVKISKCQWLEIPATKLTEIVDRYIIDRVNKVSRRRRRDAPSTPSSQRGAATKRRKC